MRKSLRITAITVPAAMLSIFAIITYITAAGIIHPYIMVKGLEICNITKQQALERLKGKIEPTIANSFIVLNSNMGKWKLSFTEADFSYKYDEAVNKAYILKDSGNIFTKAFRSINLPHSSSNIDIAFTVDDVSISNFVDKVAKEVDKPIVDATIKYENGKFTITDDIPGKSLDKNTTYDLIKQQLETATGASIELPIKVIDPKIKKTDLLNVKDKLGEFSTEFNASDYDRVSNLSLATRNASNILILPDEVFSFNKIVGPRLEKYGFKMAKIIMNNQYVSGIGGGICQVSSTLYNAVLYSKLEIVERKNHTLPSTYVDMGRDATISEDYIDLKFKNNTGYSIYIYGEMKGNKVKFTVYGKNDIPYRFVEIKTEIVSKTDPATEIIEDSTLPEGTVVEERKASPSYTVKSYKVVKEKGKEDIIVPLYTDIYPLVNGIKRVGIKK